MKQAEITTPVVFIIFNRPDLTKRVFESIRKAKPKKLFIIADGPRFPKEKKLCLKTRKIVKNVDWDCNVKTNFSSKNLGCSSRIISGLDWVFSQVEEAIILEDDCLPAPSFFSFCQELLKKYRFNKRVMNITGTDYRKRYKRKGKESYYFTKYACVWGWATWKRAWELYDRDLKTYSLKKNKLFLRFDDSYEKNWWKNQFDYLCSLQPELSKKSWDWQWIYTCLVYDGLSATPSENLISNLGFNRKDATHGKLQAWYSNLPLTKRTLKIIHPKKVVLNNKNSLFIFRRVFAMNSLEKNYLFFKIKNRFYTLSNTLKTNFTFYERLVRLIKKLSKLSIKK